jgi:hypothetical protein
MLDEHDPVVQNMASAGRKEGRPLAIVEGVHEMTREQDSIEPPAQIERLDIAHHGLRPPYPPQHLGRLIDCDDPVPEVEQ